MCPAPGSMVSGKPQCGVGGAGVKGGEVERWVKGPKGLEVFCCEEGFPEG